MSIYGYSWKKRRYGGRCSHELVEFKNREYYSKNEWEEYQTVQLRRVLLHAFDTVPFYKDLYSKYGFNRGDFLKFSLNDLNGEEVLYYIDLTP